MRFPMPVLSVMMRMAEFWGNRAHNSNPCKKSRRYKMKPKERYLSAAEMARLNAALTHDEFWCQHVVTVLRLLMLTGCRLSEIVCIEWDWIKGKRIFLRDAKSGARMAPLTLAVQGVLAEIPRVPDNPWVIAGQKPGARMTNVNDPWLVVRARAGLEDVRIHDLRHSWASRALALGESLSMIGKLLGHNRIETTARYAHLARDTEKASAAKIGGSIGADILPADGAEAA